MKENKIKGGLAGLCVGDALGVPVEFKSRESLKASPVKDMLGYGTHSQPKGTWSDDSSLTFCLAESLTGGFNLDDIADKFIKWMHEGYWTPYGKAFDIGRTTYIAISRLKDGISPLDSGLAGERDNGNGSLMRILPLAFYIKDMDMDKKIDIIHKVSSITHAHPRALIACSIYVQFAIELLNRNDLDTSYRNTVEKIKGFYRYGPYNLELKFFKRIMDKDIKKISEDNINSTGYVIDTLETSLWCLLKYRSFKDAVLAAVNLGYDTDTTGAVTGGLAGIYYSMENIFDTWIDNLARKDDIVSLALRLEESMS